MTTVHREVAERRQRHANLAHGLFVLDEGGRELLADWQHHTTGSPGLRATGAASSVEFAYQTGYHDGRKSFVEDLVGLIAEGAHPIARQTQAEETAG